MENKTTQKVPAAKATSKPALQNSNKAMPIKDKAMPKMEKQMSTSNKGMIKHSQLMKLFEDELKDIYWAEKALTKAIPKMIKNATSTELSAALKSHLEETIEQVSRLDEVFASIDKKAVAKKCQAMDGLIREAGEIMESCEKGAMRDAGIISAAQKIEHYEIATYGTLHQFATILGLTEAASLLEETLIEEKSADAKLTEVAVATINIEAAELEDKTA
jgi:ferritin-like metal-binding protein YciE